MSQDIIQKMKRPVDSGIYVIELQDFNYNTHDKSRLLGD